MHNTYTKILANIKNKFKESGKKRAVIQISGGIDSSLALKLLQDAIDPKLITALILPEKGVSKNENIKHAKTLCTFFQVESQYISINKFLPDFKTLAWQPSDEAQANTKSRIRMSITYNYADSNNAIVFGTANKTDLLIGYGSKFGDLAADIHILGDLFKEDIIKLARHLELPEELIDKPASKELYPEQNDEDDLGMKQNEIESVLKQHLKGVKKEVLINKGINPNTVHKTLRLISENRHKTEKIPIIKAHE